MVELRRVMSAFATGVTVLTVGGARPNGMTANSFSSVSLDPPLVLCCVSRTARMYPELRADGRFAVSILGADHEDVAHHFADRTRPNGWEQFDRSAWRRGPCTGAPLLRGALAWLECSEAREVTAGDHAIFIARVLDATVGADAPALLFHDRALHELPRMTAVDAMD